MPLVNSTHRSQLLMLSLDEKIEDDNIVRVVDAYVSSFAPAALGFIIKGECIEGRPAFGSDCLIKLYIYGYLNGIRSSRKLHKACKRNIELWWLLHHQVPSYKTIANFRKDNPEAFVNLFKHFREFCISLNAFGKSTVAIDGSKFRAQNSKKNNYNIRKIQKHLEYIDSQEKDYLLELQSQDQKDQQRKKLKKRKKKYQDLKDKLDLSDQTQISTTDPDARALPLHMNIIEVGYNVQSVVDDKHNLIVHYEVTNTNDLSALSSLASKAKSSLQLNDDDPLTVLADKGYYSGEQIDRCQINNIDTLVSPRKKSSSGKDQRVQKDKFIYDKSKDVYICPKGQRIKRQGSFYKRKDGTLFKRYVALWSKCKDCPLVDVCVSPGSAKAKRGRMLNRSIYEDALDKNDVEFYQRKNEYKRRQAIVEHPFGTIKRQWGFTHALMKTKKHVNTEFSLIFLCYNLKRLVQIFGAKGLINALCLLFIRFFNLWQSKTDLTKLNTPRLMKHHTSYYIFSLISSR